MYTIGILKDFEPEISNCFGILSRFFSEFFFYFFWNSFGIFSEFFWNLIRIQLLFFNEFFSEFFLSFSTIRILSEKQMAAEEFKNYCHNSDRNCTSKSSRLHLLTFTILKRKKKRKSYSQNFAREADGDGIL